MKNLGRILLLCCLTLMVDANTAFSQCGGAVPTLVVDLTGSPDSVWISPNVARNDNCCGTSSPDRCIQFIITLDPDAVGISFDILSGAVPGGALFYQIGCGPPSALGSPICLTGVGPHILTFCKPGNNANEYIISSIPGPTAGDDEIVNDGCTGILQVSGFDSTTITWQSIFPGATGAYNSYLSCTSGCATNLVTPSAGFPPFVDYMVCGISAALCSTTPTCDTVRVYFNPTLLVSILPINPTICFGSPSTTLTATGAGGLPPYTYLWSTGITTSSLVVTTPGSYTIVLGDASGCPPTSANVVVTQFTNPITANAGADVYTCYTMPNVILNGSVTGVSTGAWSGGLGAFIPNSTTLNATYIPTVSEISAGFVNLILSTTNNGTCPGDADTMTIYFTNFDGLISFSTTPVSCSGGINGSATTLVTGGTGPFSYSWNTSPIQTTSTITGLASGYYTVTITDAFGCVGSDSVFISQPFPLSSITSMSPALCNGQNNGSASVTASGGTSPYTYLWTPSGQTGDTALNLTAGSYNVNITDNNGCSINANIVVTEPPLLLVSVSSDSVSCTGGNNGSVTATASGGTPMYFYLWTPSSSTASSATGLIAGTYSVTVTDFNGCTNIQSIEVIEPLPLTLVISKSDETCAELNNGIASATVGGGSPPYTYLWLPGGATTSSVTGLASGSYSVQITDAEGCQIIGFFTITQPNPLIVNFSSIIPVNCFGGADGSATSSVIGGTSPFTYLWSPSGGTGATATGLTAGVYTLTVTDDNGCVAFNTVTIAQPATPLSVDAEANNANCFGASDGELTATGNGGTLSYTFLWTPGGFTTASVIGVSAGTYTVTITDANGCTASDPATVTQPSEIILTMGSVNSSCSMANGEASVSVSGGSSPYTYSWSPTGGSTDTATGLLSGNYIVTVTDFNGCIVTGMVNVNDNAGPVASIIATTNVSCFGGNDGTATVGYTGGTGPFTFLWTPSGGTDSIATGLIAGTYTVIVLDANGCQSLATTSPSITEPPALIIATNFTNSTCFGSNDGTASAIVSDGTPGYTYLWTGGMTTSSVSGLSPGTYSVTATDLNNCQIIASVIISEPPILTGSITAQFNVSCFGGNNGSATVTGAGGTPGYTYSWSPYGGTTNTAVGLIAGSYTVSIIDANGCSTSVIVTITQPATPLFVSTSSTTVSCFGGSDGTASAFPSGGTPGYTFLWSPGGSVNPTATGLIAGTYSVIVTDFNGCNYFTSANVGQPAAMNLTINTIDATCGNANGLAGVSVAGGTGPYTYLWTPSGGTSSIASSLLAGSYNVLVTDAQGCSQNVSTIINNIPGPTLLVLSLTDVSCFGMSDGSATIGVLGGTGPFTYLWTPSGGTTLTESLLPAGNYTFNVFDANGCFNSITVTIAQPLPLNLTFPTITNVSCSGGNNGSIVSSVSGGTSPYSYSWSPSGGFGPSASSLSAGTYTLQVIDNNGCLISNSATITEPSPVTVIIVNSINPSCFAGSNGSLEALGGGGTPGYTYLWNTIPVQTGNIATGLSSGTYSVTVTDAAGCTAITTGNLINPSQVATLAGLDDTVCLGNSVTLSASASGGTAPYFYDWTPTSSSTLSSITISPTTSTSYTVTAYDNFGCSGSSDTIDVIVYNLSPAVFGVMGYTPICPGSSTLIYAYTIGDQGPLTFTWNNGLGPGPGAFLVTPPVPTTYIVTVTNSCGASVTDSVEILFNPPPTIIITSDTTSGCMPLTVNFSDLSTTVSTDSILSWNWTFGDGTSSTNQNPTHIYPNAGTYNVSLAVVTWGGCTSNSASSPYVINVYPNPTANFSVSDYTLDLPYDNLYCTNLSTGAVSYSWNFGDGATATTTNPIHVYGTIGTYTITLTATNIYGCSDIATQTVVATSQIVFPNAFTPDPNGSNNGQYDVTDLSNNVFFPYTSGVDSYHLLIFNRWGELIFESFDLYTGWDGYYRGVLCTQDVYVWKAKVSFIDGREFEQTGDLTLLR